MRWMQIADLGGQRVSRVCSRSSATLRILETLVLPSQGGHHTCSPFHLADLSEKHYQPLLQHQPYPILKPTPLTRLPRCAQKNIEPVPFVFGKLRTADPCDNDDYNNRCVNFLAASPPLHHIMNDSSGRVGVAAVCILSLTEPTCGFFSRFNMSVDCCSPHRLRRRRLCVGHEVCLEGWGRRGEPKVEEWRWIVRLS